MTDIQKVDYPSKTERKDQFDDETRALLQGANAEADTAASSPSGAASERVATTSLKDMEGPISEEGKSFY